MSSVKEDLNEMLMAEVLEKIMPMIEKQLPKVEKALFDSISGKDDGIEKAVIIRAKEEKVFAIVFEASKLNVNATEEPINVLNSAELIAGLLKDGFNKKD
jgi:hypothetical protein